MSASRGKQPTIFVLVIVLASSIWVLYACSPKQAGDFIDQAIAGFYGQTVTVPLRDTTPPVATLKIPDIGSGAKTLTTGQPDITIPITKNQSPFFKIAQPDDPEGVKEVDLLGGGVINCNNGQGIGSRTFVDFPNGVVASDISAAKPRGTATNRRSVIHQINLDEWPCPDASFHLVNVSINMQAAGTNFSGLKTVSPTATFTFTP